MSGDVLEMGAVVIDSLGEAWPRSAGGIPCRRRAFYVVAGVWIGALMRWSRGESDRVVVRKYYNLAMWVLICKGS